MIPYAPHPILFQIGPLAIRYYSLVYILGFVLAYVALKTVYGKKLAEDIATAGLLAVIIGGRVGEFIFYSPRTFITDPLEILKIWHGGMSFHGALIAVVLTMIYMARKRKLSFWKLGDTVAAPMALTLGFGRIANFLNGELVGTVTNVPWCMQFPGFDGCRHPSQLYEAFYSFVLAGVLFWQSRKKHQEGFVFVLFVFLYGVFRFVFNFFRDDPRLFGISTGQYLSLAMILIAGYFLVTKYKKSLLNVFT
jgi:phosphatidylglycerol---prolipoprotein diacylglyceryl transferase